MDESNIDLYETCNEIIAGIPKNYTNDQKLRKLYIEVGKILSKSTEFFYEKNPERQKEIYEHYQLIENREVICRSVVYLYCSLAEKLGISCRPLEMDDIEGINFNHWAIVYENDNKKYLLNPIPDFYRVQLGFSTKSFCHTQDYYACSSETFDTMTDDYLRNLDASIGYIKSENGLYTDELLFKFGQEVTNKIGKHIIRTSDFYQDYYNILLDLIKNKSLTIEQKLEEIKKIDYKFDSHKEIIQTVFEKEIISSKMKKEIHNMAYQTLIDTPIDLSISREGANFIGKMDVSKLKELKSQIMLYKFQYMMNCIPKFTTSLTGYIENKNFIEELSKFLFHSSEEKECLHRHTVVQNISGKKEYFLIFSVKDLDESSSFYCFYNHKTKSFEMPIEPIKFMIKNKMKPLKNSTLHDEIARSMKQSVLYSKNIFESNFNVSKR